MYSTNRDKVWTDYYAAVRAGNKELANKLLRILHSPPVQNIQNQSGCRSCRSKFY
jgi:hypothetical protein